MRTSASGSRSPGEGSRTSRVPVAPHRGHRRTDRMRPAAVSVAVAATSTAAGRTRRRHAQHRNPGGMVSGSTTKIASPSRGSSGCDVPSRRSCEDVGGLGRPAALVMVDRRMGCCRVGRGRRVSPRILLVLRPGDDARSTASALAGGRARWRSPIGCAWARRGSGSLTRRSSEPLNCRRDRGEGLHRQGPGRPDAR